MRAEAEDVGITADWMRRAQGLAVGVYRRKDGPPACQGFTDAGQNGAPMLGAQIGGQVKYIRRIAEGIQQGQGISCTT